MDTLKYLDSIKGMIKADSIVGGSGDLRHARLAEVNYAIKGLNELIAEVLVNKDSITILKARDMHIMSTTHLVKHTLLAVAVYDFAVDGSAATTIDLNTGVDMLPDNAIIKKVYYEITTDLDSTSSTSTFKFKTEEFDLTTAVTADGTNAADGIDGVMDGAGANMDKLTAASKIQIETSVADITAGVAKIFIEYVIGG